MRALIFSLLFALCIALIRAGGDSYEATWYGGSLDQHREKNPSCLDDEWPDTEYYAAVDTDYDHKLCNSYAVVMGVTDDGHNLGKMVKVKIVDSCRECEPSHIDISRKAFTSIRKAGDGRFKIIWVAATKDGKVTRDVIYPSSATEEFAKKSYGLSKSQFVSMFKKQALKMITGNETHGTFNKHDTPRTTTTRRTTTTTRRTTTRAERTTTRAEEKATEVPAPFVDKEVGKQGLNGLGDINVVTGETKDQSVPDAAPIVGKSKSVDPNKTDYTEEDLKVLEDQNKVDENDNNNYTVGVLTTTLTVSGAAGIGLLYLKKKSPSKYDELKQKFPDAFDNIKRNVSRSATSIRRGVTKSIRKNRKNTTDLNRHGDHTGINYREMPEHMFGSDGLPRIELHDEPMSDFPETKIQM